jgi:hypothetical protein
LLRYNVGAALRGRPNNPHLTIEKGWNETENKFHCVSVDKYVILPNHIHAIIALHTADGRNAGDHAGSPLHIRDFFS